MEWPERWILGEKWSRGTRHWQADVHRVHNGLGGRPIWSQPHRLLRLLFARNLYGLFQGLCVAQSWMMMAAAMLKQAAKSRATIGIGSSGSQEHHREMQRPTGLKICCAYGAMLSLGVLLGTSDGMRMPCPVQKKSNGR